MIKVTVKPSVYTLPPQAQTFLSVHWQAVFRCLFAHTQSSLSPLRTPASQRQRSDKTQQGNYSLLFFLVVQTVPILSSLFQEKNHHVPNRPLISMEVCPELAQA